MFGTSEPPASAPRRIGPRTALDDAAAITGVVESLCHLNPDATDAERIDRIRALEELKSAVAAAQAHETVALHRSVVAADTARGIPAAKRGKGVGAQVALARRESPHAGGRHLGFARAMVEEMPFTYAGLRAGRISEYRATLLVQETATLSREDRARVDRELMADPSKLAHKGNRAVAGEARKAAHRLDPGAAVRRARKAENDRRVTIRPAPDTMVYLSALLPVKQGVAAFAALSQAATSARSAGDPRGRGQVMADTLVERVTGQSAAGATGVEIQLVMTDRTLLQPAGSADPAAHEPAHVSGYGVIPAGLARDWLSPDVDESVQVWVRRLYTHPRTGELVAMDSRRRLFDNGLRRLIVTRDQFCRNAWCGAPIRHVDHAERAADGGETTATNGQGLCEACNYVKEAPGWQARPRPGPDGRHRLEVTTPTGHRYVTTPPELPGAPPPTWQVARADPGSRMEVAFSELILRCA